MIKVLFETDLKNKKGVPFLSVKEQTLTDGSKYVYAERAGVNSVKFMLIDKKRKMFGLVSEVLPPFQPVEGFHDNNKTVGTFGGSIDSHLKNLLGLVIQEVKEETGFSVKAKDIYYTGKTMVSNQMNELAYTYLVDVSELKPTSRNLEDGEKNSAVVWLFEDELYSLGDCISIFIHARALRNIH